VRHNTTLGRFELTDIAPAPRGVPQIDVIFDIDANGITRVSAQDKATGKQQHMVITAASGISPEEIERMEADAKTHAEEDTHHATYVAAYNAGDAVLYSAAKMLQLAGDAVDDTIRQDVIDKMDVLKAALQSNQEDAVSLRIKTDAVSLALQQVQHVLNSTLQHKNDERSSK
jgi:molecular chaperone DnaK